MNKNKEFCRMRLFLKLFHSSSQTKFIITIRYCLITSIFKCLIFFNILILWEIFDNRPQGIAIRIGSTMLALQNLEGPKIYKRSFMPFYRAVFQNLKILIFIFIRLNRLYFFSFFTWLKTLSSENRIILIL